MHFEFFVWWLLWSCGAASSATKAWYSEVWQYHNVEMCLSAVKYSRKRCASNWTFKCSQLCEVWNKNVIGSWNTYSSKQALARSQMVTVGKIGIHWIPDDWYDWPKPEYSNTPKIWQYVLIFYGRRFQAFSLKPLLLLGSRKSLHLVNSHGKLCAILPTKSVED